MSPKRGLFSAKLTTPWEQAPEGLWAGRDFDMIL